MVDSDGVAHDGASPGAPALFGDGARRAITGLAILSLVSVTVLLVFGRRLAAEPPKPRDSYGHGPLGHRAFADTLTRLGVNVVRWRRPRYEDVTAPLFFIEPDATLIAVEGVDLDLAKIVDARAALGRATVIVIPKWKLGTLGIAELDDDHLRREVADAAQGTTELFEPKAPSEDWSTTPARFGASERLFINVRRPQRVLGLSEVLGDDEGAFIGLAADGLTYVIAEPDLLHNFSLTRGDHAQILHRFVREVLATDSIVIDEVFHGQRDTKQLPELLGQWPGVLLLVQLAFVALVIVLRARRRFGPPTALAEAWGRGPREVIQVAASVLAVGSRPGTLALRYVESLLHDAHRRLGLAPVQTTDAVAAALDVALAGRGETALAAPVLAEARALAAGRRVTPAQALATARRATMVRQRIVSPPKSARGAPSSTRRDAIARSAAPQAPQPPGEATR